MKLFTCQFCKNSWGVPDASWKKIVSCPYCNLPVKKRINIVEEKSLEMKIYTALYRKGISLLMSTEEFLKEINTKSSDGEDELRKYRIFSRVCRCTNYLKKFYEYCIAEPELRENMIKASYIYLFEEEGFSSMYSEMFSKFFMLYDKTLLPVCSDVYWTEALENSIVSSESIRFIPTDFSIAHYKIHDSGDQYDDKVTDKRNFLDKKELTRGVIEGFVNNRIKYYNWKKKDELKRVPYFCPENINLEDIICLYKRSDTSIIITEHMVCSNFSCTPIYLKLLSSVTRIRYNLIEFSYDMDCSVHYWESDDIPHELMEFLQDIVAFNSSL